jgi:hypothetical protein
LLKQATLLIEQYSIKTPYMASPINHIGSLPVPLALQVNQAIDLSPSFFRYARPCLSGPRLNAFSSTSTLIYIVDTLKRVYLGLLFNTLFNAFMLLI